MALSSEQRAFALHLLRDLEFIDMLDGEELIARVNTLRAMFDDEDTESSGAQTTLEALETRLEMMLFQLCAAQRVEAMRGELRRTLQFLMDTVPEG
ncbi:hypothetical protein EA187_03630 [Lujinxingia sediminis]|uniref:Uncharacterized protein n=1 Tax=Lujinxingia sediminis TaxID=2480984 RepID=A0ABY0CY10_9DELT|nr:hypothetical protein [Lujinxingia sediminis]RVU48535.1 hypothetical protein EA187_03630 [Lujinxingia sediminis]